MDQARERGQRVAREPLLWYITDAVGATRSLWLSSVRHTSQNVGALHGRERSGEELIGSENRRFEFSSAGALTFHTTF